MKLNEFFPYFIASCLGAAIYLFIVYLFNPGYDPRWQRLVIKIVFISAIMSLSIVFFKKKIGKRTNEEEGLD